MPDRISYLSVLTTLVSSTIPDVMVMKKFCESFSNGAQVYTVYVRNATKEQLALVASKMSTLPYAPERLSTHLFNHGYIQADELVYMNAINMFAFYFTPSIGSEDYTALAQQMKHNPIKLGRLKKLRNELFTEVLTEYGISRFISYKYDIVRELYKDFVKGPTVESCKRLEKMLAHELRAHTDLEQMVFRSFLTFNRSVIRTNFFKNDKSAIAFRLDPQFVADLDFPRVPYAIFIVLGTQFRGFHVRFSDIARGGVRLVLSRNVAAYVRNKQTLFNENYNLAYAQHLKNKDIPEGGSKGIILTSMRCRLRPRTIFLQYIDALLDLIIPNTPGVRTSLATSNLTTVSHDVLFLGPDENTAGAFPALAALHSKSRGYAHWKSLTTGKSATLGGIPHDEYGMTSNGVRTYVNCVYEKLHLDPSKLTKFQTGGPDGDLGSNEIKLANERYVAIVDGSGCIYDPAGLNIDELRRLAHSRSMLKEYAPALLSKDGFFVNVEAKNVTLPDGYVVEDGELFRNTFHFSRYATADTFVPCGGRPASINIDNVHHLVLDAPKDVTGQHMLEGRLGNLAASGKLKFKYIVEGANLFITHDARIALENVGVVLIKDSSANKAGVTCSSFEVLAGLAFSDAEHKRVMCVSDSGVVPEFYKAYVAEIIVILKKNAAKEFECLWREKQAGSLGGKMTLISDALSSKITEIRGFVSESDLDEDDVLVDYVLKEYFPKTLQAQIKLTELKSRVPAPYLRAIFAIGIAANFVYTTGLAANQFAFFQYMNQLSRAAHGIKNTKKPAKL